MTATIERECVDAAPVLSEALLRRFDTPGPRYTSYPTADRFVEAFGAAELSHVLQQRAQGGALGSATPLSVYVHIPFCESLCYYCACNNIITRHHEREAEYLDPLDVEIELLLAQMKPGCGVPTALRWRLADLPVRCRTAAGDGCAAPRLQQRRGR